VRNTQNLGVVGHTPSSGSGLAICGNADGGDSDCPAWRGLLTCRAMRTADFDYQLPPKLIAQHPAAQRDGSRLLVLQRAAGHLEHRQFGELPDFLRAGDVLVLNNSKVIPARLRGINARTRGRFEILLLEENAVNDWWVMVRPGKRARVGTRITMLDREGNPTHTQAIVSATNSAGHRRLVFDGPQDIAAALPEWGQVPLPPYIVRTNPQELVLDQERYQTVFAEHAGSVAAPTAGLHFTESLLEKIRARGVGINFITLHVGPGTFAPVKTETLAAHTMHEERYEVSDATARAVNEAKDQRRRVVAVGTTSVRVLESIAARHQGRLVAGDGRTRIFIYPPFEFRIVDALLTNFHLPCSSLLMLVSAFAAPGRVSGRETILSAYAEAIHQRYRFFSYGDAMLIL
jgi:S-adenosylmethionine:tRNA ribosyltransferase-isomerase